MNLSLRLRCNDHLTSPPVDLLLVFWCLLAFAATPLLMLRISPYAGPLPQWGASLAGLVVGVVLLQVSRPMIAKLRTRIQALPTPLIALLVGAALRLAWVLVFPSTPQSDGRTYLQLARALADGAPYQTAGTFAYWPVGYPLWLAGWLQFVDVPGAVLLSQLVAYIVGFMGIYRLARRLRGEGAARIAAWSFALWPNLLAQLATPEKESVVIALLPWVMLAVLDAAPKWSAFVAGLALGFAILVQPSLQFLLPLVLVMYWLRLRGNSAFLPALLITLGTAMVVLPWTLRNIAVLGAPVLVSTNGGENLYRANNPLANGGYTDVGEKDLSGLSELERDRQGRQLAVQWIRANPFDFLALGLEKQLRFMGDDSPSIYASLKRGGGTQDMRIYALIKALGNLWWLIFWLILAMTVIANRDDGPRDERWLIWGWFYLFALHSIFESSSKYHLPMIWVLCVLLGCLVVRPAAVNTKWI